MTLNFSERAVLQLIGNHNGISRKALADQIGTSRATVTKITRKLLEQNFILEGERVGEGLGRREVLLLPNPNKYCVLGVDIGGYRIRIALLNSSLTILNAHEFPTDDLHDEPDKGLALLTRIQTFLSRIHVDTSSIDAVGLGVTGIVDTSRKVILNIPNAEHWDNVPVVEQLSTIFTCPIFLDEGGRTIAIAERAVGRAKNIPNFVALQVGYGVVAGIFMNGQPLRGESNTAGLVGHVTADERAGRCTCGNYGCLENIVTFPMLEKDFVLRGGKGKSLVEAYRMNDKISLDVCVAAGSALGIVLSNIVNIINPRAIFLGGPVFEQFPLLYEETRRTILLRANRFATVQLELEHLSFGASQGAIGAASMALSEVLPISSDPASTS